MINSIDLIKEFYESEDPDMSFEDFKKICDAPFIMMRETIEEGNLEEVRLQYLFTIRPSIQKVMKYLKIAYSNYEKGTMSKRVFERYDSMLCKFIYENPEKFKKYETSIKQITGRTIEENGRRVLSEPQRNVS